MSVRASVQYMALLGMVWPAAEVTSNKVEQFPKFLKVARGANASMFCTFPLFQDIPDVYWWKRGEGSFLKPDSRKRFNVKKGSSSFDVLNASVADSGMYYCKVKHQESIGDGSGSQLTVYVPPTPLKIVAVETSATSLKLECKTVAFYPEHLEISWLRDGVEILSGIETVKNKSTEELYEVSSFLEEAQPAPKKVVYTCLASHISLLVPASVSYTVNRGSKKDSAEAGQAEEQVRQAPSEQLTAYATLNLRDDKGPPKRRHEIEHTVYPQTEQEFPYTTVETRTRNNAKHRQKEQRTVYAQTKQRSGENQLTYAALQLADSKKTSKPKQDKSAVYAEVNVIKKERS
ncbi:tyrosine-protein phosphatase non-receptor type substrate 1-like isoform X2 [Heterodontus francisci]|uniref:tyrosine-protein phosphatase non-receptor type substrate 1-like isoform X2 n=1 Tax=Heterodontus francisci TaxID=7792 RepID=UPI00355C26A1